MIILAIMDYAFTPILIWIFVCLLLLVSNVICVMILRDNRRKQKLYTRFKGNLNEFIIVFSSKKEFLYGLPMFMSDPLFDQLNQGRTFEEIIGKDSWKRVKDYFEQIENHRDLPVLFALLSDNSGEDKNFIKSIWYEMRVSLEKINHDEFRYVCFVRNISKENVNRKEKEALQYQRDSLLQNTGDFLWSFDVENRQMKLLTPMLDEDHRVIPCSAGTVDIQKKMPPSDYALLDKVINTRVKAYRNYGFHGDPFDTIKVRFFGDKSLVWYGLRCKLCMDEDHRLVLQGSARRMDMVLDNYVEGTLSGSDESLMLSSVLSFPDIRIFWLNRDFRIMGCNQAFATDFQIIDARETFGKKLENVVSDKYYPYVKRIVDNVLSANRCYSWKARFNEGRDLLLSNAVPLKVENELVQQVMCVYLFLKQEEFDDEKLI